MQNIEQLNEQFGIKDQLQFVLEEGFIMVDIFNQYANARISTYAGHVISFCPIGEKNDVLFLSDKVIYQQGKAIRGGAPICWPWFGDDTSEFGRPSHGFARNQQWQVLGSLALADGRTSISLALTDTKASLAIWPHNFVLELEVIVGKCLEINLTTKNTGKKEFSITQALHTYFNISDVSNVVVEGLDNKTYLDKLDSFNTNHQTGNVTLSGEIDRVYQQAPEKVLLNDSGFNRTISIRSKGSATTVIWNPWSTSVTNISDLDDSSYRNFVCVETTNAADDLVTVAANSEHTITAIYEVI